MNLSSCLPLCYELRQSISAIGHCYDSTKVERFCHTDKETLYQLDMALILMNHFTAKSTVFRYIPLLQYSREGFGQQRKTVVGIKKKVF